MPRSLPPILLAALVISACSGDISAPESVEASASDQIASPVAQVDRGTGVFHQDWTGTIDCAGEDVRFVFQVPYTWQLTATPTGTHLIIHFVDKGSTGIATGQTSGTTWTLDQIALTEVDTERNGLFIHYTGTGIWRSTNGPTIRNHELWKFRIDAAGDIVLDDFTIRFTCRRN